jgi:hypothetical protein
VLWLRADKGVTIATGVSTWKDQSGAGNDYTQGTGGNQPGFSATGNARGTGPALTFNGTSQFLSRASAVLANTNLTLFLVAKTTTTASGQAIVSMGNSNASQGWDATIDLNAGNERDITAGGVAVMTDGTCSTSWEEWTVQRDATTWTMSVDGSSQVLSVPTTNPGAQAAVSMLGARTNAAPGSFLSGSIDEVIAYSRKLVASEVAQVESYIRARTGIW